MELFTTFFSFGFFNINFSLMNNRFIDLDELVLMCRDPSSRKFIQEAVSCYRANAFRSCIVATWNAVVFDYLHKLRELKLFGDRNAKAILDGFDNLRKNENFQELWKFESNIPKNACEEFELISKLEQDDIERLFQDRSRCAHPSMISLEEPFEATAELARCHLRCAITHLLQHPPVQGRKAKDAIFQSIKSEYFPTDVNSAIEYFKNSPLARARPILIKDIVNGITIDLLIQNRENSERARQFSALSAILKMYPADSHEILKTHLSKFIRDRVTDDSWGHAIIYLGNIPDFVALDKDCEIKTKAYIEKVGLFDINSGGQIIEDNLVVLVKAAHVDFLKSEVIDKLREKQISTRYIFRIYENRADRFIKSEVLFSIITALSDQATLNELLSIWSEPLLRKEEKIRQSLKEVIGNLFLDDLIQVTGHVNYGDEFLIHSVESHLQKICCNANLEELLDAKEVYQYSHHTTSLGIETLENAIVQQLEAISPQDLLDQNKNWNSVPREYQKILLKNHVSLVIKRFAESWSFDKAARNADLLVEISEDFTLSEWEEIMAAFLENDQIYSSWFCFPKFEKLFVKSIDVSGQIEDFWIEFREKINKFSSDPYGLRDRLKNMMDSYILLKDHL